MANSDTVSAYAEAEANAPHPPPPKKKRFNLQIHLVFQILNFDGDVFPN